MFEREIAEIKAKPYARELIQDSDGSWFAKIVEFPGCMTVGDTQEDALHMLDDAMTGWLRVMLEDGDPIPAPASEEAFSGRTMVRLGKDLHRLAAAAADRDGVSLNHFITTQVARGVGALSVRSRDRELEHA